MDFIYQLINGRDSILVGALTTVSVAVCAIVSSTMIGVLLGTALAYGNKFVAIPIRIYVDIMRGLPGLVAVFISYYLLGFGFSAIGIDLSPWGAGVIALSALGAADVTELTRGAFQSIDRGQTDAGKAIGLRFWQILLSILLPQSLVRIMPPWTNTATELVKGTTLLSLIGVTELLLTANRLVATSGSALWFFVAIGIVFFVINSLIQVFARATERKFDFKRYGIKS